jgi:ral guanine nucleotide dissociation stimulator-like 1
MLAVQGTVPYLGTFLTDLTMVDTAFRDTTDDGLINFDKRRREFEILTQIKLFQSAASLYHIAPDAQFTAWFQNIPTYDDKERFVLSQCVAIAQCSVVYKLCKI